MENEDWREVIKEQFRGILELGGSGVLYDETTFRQDMDYCFAGEAHGHSTPAYLLHGDRLLIRELRNICRETGREEYLFAAESTNDALTSEYGLSYFRVLGPHAPVQLYLYRRDHVFLCGVYGMDDRDVLNTCLAFRYLIEYEPKHFRGEPNEFPATLRYGKQIDALRKQYHDRLWDVSPLPLSDIGATETPSLIQALYGEPQTGRRTLVIANSADSPATVSLEPCRGWNLVTPENPEKTDFEGPTLILAGHTVAVLLEP